MVDKKAYVCGMFGIKKHACGMLAIKKHVCGMFGKKTLEEVD